MKRILGIILGVLFSSSLYAQQLNQNYAFTAAASTPSINIIGRGLNYFQIVYTNTGPTVPSACTTVLQTSPDNLTWSTGISATCTSDGASSVTAINTSYIRVNTSTLTRASQSTLTVNIIGWLADPTVNGSVTGSGVNTRCAFWNGAVSLTSDADCTFVTDTLTATKIVGPTSITSPSYNITGATSGIITLTSDTGTYGIVFPTSAGTSGYILSTDGTGITSWIAQSGGGGSPGGSDTQIQFNNMGAFGGDAGLTYNGATLVVQPAYSLSGVTLTINPQINDGATLASFDGLDIGINSAGGVGTTIGVLQGLYVQPNVDVVTTSSTSIIADSNITSAPTETGIRIQGITHGIANSIGLSIADVTGAMANRAIQTGAGDILFGTLASGTDSLPVCRHADGTLYSGTNVAGVAHCS